MQTLQKIRHEGDHPDPGWGKGGGTPQYIAALEKTQLQAARAEITIPDNYTMMIATKAMLSLERFT